MADFMCYWLWFLILQLFFPVLAHICCTRICLQYPYSTTSAKNIFLAYITPTLDSSTRSQFLWHLSQDLSIKILCDSDLPTDPSFLLTIPPLWLQISLNEPSICLYSIFFLPFPMLPLAHGILNPEGMCKVTPHPSDFWFKTLSTKQRWWENKIFGISLFKIHTLKHSEPSCCTHMNQSNQLILLLLLFVSLPCHPLFVIFIILLVSIVVVSSLGTKAFCLSCKTQRGLTLIVTHGCTIVLLLPLYLKGLSTIFYFQHLLSTTTLKTNLYFVAAHFYFSFSDSEVFLTDALSWCMHLVNKQVFPFKFRLRVSCLIQIV